MKSEICSATADRITVRGLDLTTDILGHLDIGQMAFLDILGRLPTKEEDIVFNSLVVAMVEHGLVPSVLAARLTYLGAPDSFQAAVAAGLSGLGSVFVGSIEGAARMLQEGVKQLDAGIAIEVLAAEIVAKFKAEKRAIPGLGHPIHKEADPRTARLLAIAAENGFEGRHIALLHAVARQAEQVNNRALPINVSGAIGAIASEIGLDWRICRGIGLIARSIGLVAHLLEEIKNPMARELWLRTEKEAQEGAE
jgi:citrate synthase